MGFVPADRVIAEIGPRRLAETITRPSSLLLAGGAAAVAIVGGLGLPIGIGVGAVAWLVKSAVALGRARKVPAEVIDAFRVSEPWRQYVQSAQQSKLRFDRSVANMRKGPLREHLDAIAERMDDGVRETWNVARKAHALEQALDELDMRGTQRELDAAEREAASDPARAEALAPTIASIRSRLATAERLTGTGQKTQDRLRQLEAQLDELVARSVELSVNADESDVTSLRSDVDATVSEMEALRQAMDDTSRLGGPATYSGGRGEVATG